MIPEITFSIRTYGKLVLTGEPFDLRSYVNR